MDFGLLSMIASQVASKIGVSFTPRSHLATKVFYEGDRKLVAIEQNPNTGSKWAVKAQQGHKVVQFKDTATNRYVAVSVDGKVIEYYHGQKSSA